MNKSFKYHEALIFCNFKISDSHFLEFGKDGMIRSWKKLTQKDCDIVNCHQDDCWKGRLPLKQIIAKHSVDQPNLMYLMAIPLDDEKIKDLHELGLLMSLDEKHQDFLHRYPPPAEKPLTESQQMKRRALEQKAESILTRCESTWTSANYNTLLQWKLPKGDAISKYSTPLEKKKRWKELEQHLNAPNDGTENEDGLEQANGYENYLIDYEV